MSWEMPGWLESFVRSTVECKAECKAEHTILRLEVCKPLEVCVFRAPP